MPSETLTGQLDRITFHNPENGYTIAQLTPEGGGRPVTLVGSMASPSEGETVEVEGEWTTHPRYGRQLQVNVCRPVYPTSEEGIERYLASGLLPGIGPVTARRIVEQFGEHTLEVIDQNPKKLLRISGLGRKRVARISEAWKDQRQIRDVMVFLQAHGVGTGQAVRIYRQYGDEAIDVVRANPYRLERDIRGMGFLTADKIASQLGMASEAPERIAAGLRYLLNQAADDGHVFLPETEVVERGSQLLGVEAGLVPPALEALRADGGVASEDSRHYLPRLFRAEVAVAQALVRLLERTETGPLEPVNPLGGAEDAAPGSEKVDLSEGQRRAVAMALEAKVMVLTGGPGTGKTTVTRSILQALEAADCTVLLCSPTGRAAKRLSEATAREARTIHRLLEFLPKEGRFRRDENEPIEADALIVDEASMIDLPLMDSLMKGLPASARLILVGDVDQLPSVGPGHVMRDIIDSGCVPVARLTQIHRQEADSQIVVNAHRVNRGELPPVENRRDGDFFTIEEEDPEAVAAAIEDLCSRRLPAHGGYDPVRDIQVLTPMYRGETGAVSLNQRLQQRLNPSGRVHRIGDRELRVGDKVLQVRNNYDKGVFNGDLGRISYLDVEEQSLAVQFEGGNRVSYEFAELDDLMLAYAMSIHRSQGSEFPVVVLPLTTQHWVMLQRNLLYTAITRARKMLVIVGSRRALHRAVSNDLVARRFTALGDRLRRTSEGEESPPALEGETLEEALGDEPDEK